MQLILLPAVVHGKSLKINIIYTGNIEGELEPCGCSPKTDFGGMPRTSGYLKKHKDELSPYILLDSGNFSDKNTPQGRLKTEAMLKAFNLIQYDAVAFSEKEKRLPEVFFRQILSEYKIPVVSNLSLYNQSVTVERAGFSINISTAPAKHRKDMLNILLTSLSVSDAKLINGWDVIITSSGEIINVPLQTNNTIIVSGYPKGKKLGILTIQADNAGSVLGFEHRWQSLGNDSIEDERVRSLMTDYDTKVAQLLKKMEKPLTEKTYLGASKCAECHQPFMESWRKTRHAKAFSSLEQAGKSANPECLECHTVGFRENGGFSSAETTPWLSNVQCEACHGLGIEHLSDYSKRMKPVTKSVCLRCHTKSSSPDFNYSIYLKKIKH